MTYPDVLQMPLRTFWSYNRQVSRLRAEADQRQLQVLSCAESPEGSKLLAQRLQDEMAHPVLVSKVFDTAKFAELQRELDGKV